MRLPIASIHLPSVTLQHAAQNHPHCLCVQLVGKGQQTFHVRPQKLSACDDATCAVAFQQLAHPLRFGRQQGSIRLNALQLKLLRQLDEFVR
jgi:hypothetical protein